LAGYDPVNKLVYQYDNNLPEFYSYQLSTNTITNLSTAFSGTTCGSGANGGNLWTADIDPVRRLFICAGSTGGYKISLNPPYTASVLSMTGCATNTSAPGWAYYPVRKQFVEWAGGNTVYFYDPDTDSCTSTTYAGGPGAPQNEGTYGRFRYFPQLGVFVVANSMGQDFFSLRLDPAADTNFNYRTSQPGVLNSQGFDSASIYATAVNQSTLNDGFTVANEPNIHRDTTTFLSGGASANFLIPASSGTNDTGNYWSYFGQGSANQAFGQNSVFYVQFGFRADSAWTGTNWTQYGASGDNTAPKIVIFHNNVAGSCAQEEITTHDHDAWDMPTVYTDCGGASAYTSTDGTNYNESGSILMMQQGFTASAPLTGYECDYNNGNTPTGPNCFFFQPNTWYTLYYKVSVGTWGSPNSSIEAWVAPYGQQMKKWLNVHNFTLNTDNNCGSGGTSACPGWNTLELTQFMTDKGTGSTNNSPAANVWYDELIISNKPIPSSCLSGCTQP
jgi:hypothetical protein